MVITYNTVSVKKKVVTLSWNGIDVIISLSKKELMLSYIFIFIFQLVYNLFLLIYRIPLKSEREKNGII
jgi:hypothetical protein